MHLLERSGQVYATAAGKLPFPPAVLSEGLKFLSLCLSHSAKVTDEQKLQDRSLPVISAYVAKLRQSGG